MIDVTFTRPITKINYEGLGVKNHIIAYGRIPVSFRHKRVTEGEGAVYAVESIAVDYRYDLRINLWLVVFQFSWHWGEKPEDENLL